MSGGRYGLRKIGDSLYETHDGSHRVRRDCDASEPSVYGWTIINTATGKDGRMHATLRDAANSLAATPERNKDE